MPRPKTPPFDSGSPSPRQLFAAPAVAPRARDFSVPTVFLPETRTMAATPYILMLEDDRDDQQLTQGVLNELGIAVPIRFVAGRDELLAQLEAAEPVVILLDYNVKPDTGLEVLDAIKSRSDGRQVPVVVLGETNDPDFVRLCYGKGAASYVVKPNSFEGTRRVIRGFFTYWLQVAETPAHPSEKPVV
ncbi:MAG: response regulator [Chitinophagaceae bacterium]|nr:MAG: response regulator [Chitinophagaceae bacterium]